MKRAALRPAASTQIKDGLNTVLNVAGLQLGTTKAARAEQSRLGRLVTRGHWETAPFRQGLELDSQKYLNFLQTVCGPVAAELSALPAADAGDAGYFRNNGWFESVDADVLYGIVRHLRPARIIEVGSGFSSRLAARAIREGGLKTALTCIDPCPRVEIQRWADEYIAARVEDLPVAELTGRLGPNDFLFVDSSHLICTGGDVIYLYLQLLPQLRPGVIIHAHDIFLPFEYPQAFVVNQHWGWSEQYLLHALLIGNAQFEVLWPSCYMWQSYREKIRKVIAVEKAFPPPSSFWMRRL